MDPCGSHKGTPTLCQVFGGLCAYSGETCIFAKSPKHKEDSLPLAAGSPFAGGIQTPRPGFKDEHTGPWSQKQRPPAPPCPNQGLLWRRHARGGSDATQLSTRVDIPATMPVRARGPNRVVGVFPRARGPLIPNLTGPRPRGSRAGSPAHSGSAVTGWKHTGCGLDLPGS